MNGKPDDGGSAFPESYVGSDAPYEGVGGGMSLRDWFAGQANVSWQYASDLLLAQSGCPDHPNETQLARLIVILRYAEADAMLAERSKDEPG